MRPLYLEDHREHAEPPPPPAPGEGGPATLWSGGIALQKIDAYNLYTKNLLKWVPKQVKVIDRKNIDKKYSMRKI